jgi:hypothetical protein
MTDNKEHTAAIPVERLLELEARHDKGESPEHPAGAKGIEQKSTLPPILELLDNHKLNSDPALLEALVIFEQVRLEEYMQKMVEQQTRKPAAKPSRKH